MIHSCNKRLCGCIKSVLETPIYEDIQHAYCHHIFKEGWGCSSNSHPRMTPLSLPPVHTPAEETKIGTTWLGGKFFKVYYFIPSDFETEANVQRNKRGPIFKSTTELSHLCAMYSTQDRGLMHHSLDSHLSKRPFIRCSQLHQGRTFIHVHIPVIAGSHRYADACLGWPQEVKKTPHPTALYCGLRTQRGSQAGDT